MMKNLSVNNLIYSIFIISYLTACNANAQEKAVALNQSEELGKVHWYRDYDEAVAAAQAEQKDIVLLFQEVPGCSTCRNYGHHVLSHPLMVEALENAFIPLAIFNNKQGKDAEILKRFNEPSWNNPVVRIIDAAGRDLTKRIAGDYSAIRLCQSLQEVLSLRKKAIPRYLDVLEKELAAAHTGNTNEVYYKMYCFWTGEKQLGSVDGVLDVESGFMNHSEVVKVTYDTKLVDAKQLDDFAQNNRCTPVKKQVDYSTADNDVHYYLRHSDYKYLPLTVLQQTKINSALGNGQDATIYLSPKQKSWLNRIQNSATKGAVLYQEQFELAWAKMEG